MDLSLPVRNGTLTPPSQREIIRINTYYRRPGHWQASWISMSCHTASHVDSPLHVLANTPTIGEMPIEAFFGEAVLIDVSGAAGPNYPVSAKDLEPYGSEIREGDIVVIRTGWSDKMWGLEAYFTESPYLTNDAAEWLARRHPKAVGFDFFQEYRARFTDFAPSDFETHRILLGAGIALMEGFTNLGKLDRRRFKLFAVPIKITEAEAAPARFFAILE